ncbi:MAG TPA: TetR/AcrR family transcriptional regulator [Rectinemataceae bacterium]|nr:TetR/AcrR family transcriptional regulator [Rectinemataceae bacterium]
MSRQEQRGQTRARLIEAASSIMGRDGLLAARTADIAEEAGVAHGTVFTHFPTREDLLCAVIGELGSRLASRLHVLAEGGRELRGILEAHLAALSENEALYARLVAEGRSLPESARMSVVAIQSAISFHLGIVVERGTREGELRPMPLHLLFNTWIGLIHHYLANGDLFAPDGDSVLLKFGDELLDHFCSLVGRSGDVEPRGKGAVHGD